MTPETESSTESSTGTPTESQTEPAGPTPARARAIFSTEDFALLRTAVVHYLREIQDTPESVKYSNLYHRLGRLS